MGTDYFEFVPGPYRGQHWVPDGRLIHEETFCLIEGVFEKHMPSFNHFAFNDIPHANWMRILTDLSKLRGRLVQIDSLNIDLPFGHTWRPEEEFRRGAAENQRALAMLLLELETWARETLAVHDCVSVLGH